MKWSVAVLSLAVAAGSSSALAQSANDLKNAPLTIRGCVTQGADANTLILGNVAEVTADGKVQTPTNLASPVLYWIKDGSSLRPHRGQMVQITGRIEGIETSEIEMKAGEQKDGSLVAELEGPGKDLTARPGQIPGAVGTSGRAGKDDIKTVLIKMDVGNVSRISGSCSR